MAVVGFPIPFVKPQWFTDNGAVAAGHYLFTYDAGTTTKRNTFSDQALTTANANPIVLDSAGRATIYLSPVNYKFTLAAVSTDPPVTVVWTQDNVSSSLTSDVVGTAGEALAAGELCYMSDGSGSRTAGRWYLTDADTDYMSVTANLIGFATGAIASAAEGTIRCNGPMSGLSGLTAGTVYYISATAGALTSTAPANARPVAVASSTTAAILSQWVNTELWLPPPIRDASATVDGIVSTGAQSLAGVKTFTGHPLFEPGTSSGTAGPVSGVLSKTITATTGSGVGETDYGNFTLPAGVLDTDGKALYIRMVGKTASGASTRTIKLYWNGASILTTTTVVASAGWEMEALVTRTGAATQCILARCGVPVTLGLNTATPAVILAYNQTVWDGTSPSNATLSGTVAIKGTIQDDAAGANITALSFMVETLG